MKYTCWTCDTEHDKMLAAMNCFQSHEPPVAELTGGSSDYYKVHVERPTSKKSVQEVILEAMKRRKK